jgi:hypothetical protein
VLRLASFAEDSDMFEKLTAGARMTPIGLWKKSCLSSARSMTSSPSEKPVTAASANSISGGTGRGHPSAEGNYVLAVPRNRFIMRRLSIRRLCSRSLTSRVTPVVTGAGGGSADSLRKASSRSMVLPPP